MPPQSSPLRPCTPCGRCAHCRLEPLLPTWLVSPSRLDCLFQASTLSVPGICMSVQFHDVGLVPYVVGTALSPGIVLLVGRGPVIHPGGTVAGSRGGVGQVRPRSAANSQEKGGVVGGRTMPRSRQEAHSRSQPRCLCLLPSGHISCDSSSSSARGVSCERLVRTQFFR